MDKLFCQMQCLSELFFDAQKIHEKLFDKKTDKRYIEGSLHKFLSLNQRAFDFLGIKTIIEGAGSEVGVRFLSSNYIGAVPIRMPHNGISQKDFHISPRFKPRSDDYSDLTNLLGILDHSISPEYLDTLPLVYPSHLRAPLYYEAAKYIDLLQIAYSYGWVKFDVERKVHTFPKANTNWARHAVRSADPKEQLLYESYDSVFSMNHSEWQMLKYTFLICKDIILDSSVPLKIQYKYEKPIQEILQKTTLISPLKTDVCRIHANDPLCIKAVKRQANVILSRNGTVCTAWRNNIAELFERYVQYIVGLATKQLAGTIVSNGKMSGDGPIPQWGLKYLEVKSIIVCKFLQGK